MALLYDIAIFYFDSFEKFKLSEWSPAASKPGYSDTIALKLYSAL